MICSGHFDLLRITLVVRVYPMCKGGMILNDYFQPPGVMGVKRGWDGSSCCVDNINININRHFGSSTEAAVSAKSIAAGMLP